MLHESRIFTEAFWSKSHVAAIDHQIGASDERSLVTEQEQYGWCLLHRLAKSLQHAVVAPDWLPLGSVIAGCIRYLTGVGPSRTYTVDPDAVRAVIHG